MSRERISNWFGGPILHTHLQIEGKISREQEEFHQFTEEAAVKYLSRLCNRNDLLISDTNHAMIEISRNRSNWKKSNAESDQEWNRRRILYSSDEVQKDVINCA